MLLPVRLEKRRKEPVAMTCEWPARCRVAPSPLVRSLLCLLSALLPLLPTRFKGDPKS
jgi:hypothetical protein